MEEYRDLDLTVTAFREVLDEPEFLPLSAGIVLQAYLPDSHRVQRALTAWAIARRRRGGAPIKLRIVKGANLAMERIEAAVHGWPQAPYETKAEVDANYKRMVEYGCRPEHAAAVHLGVASHNLFDIAYGLVLREAHGVAPWVEFEMLEGMANHQARAVQARAGGLLLYAPVVRAEDFHSAIAYLVRRLDENTAPENFLRHVFDLEPGSPDWNAERDRFLAAFGLEAGLPDAPRRTQDRAAEARARARPRAARRRRSATIPTPTGPWRRTARGSRPSRRAGGSARRSDPAPGRRRAASRRAGGRGARSLAPRPRRVPLRAGRPGRRRVGRSRSPGRRRRRGPPGRRRSARRSARGVRGRARPAARRPDRRDDRRRRQDRDRGGRRGLRGRRLRALLRAHAARGRRRARRLPHGAARRRGRDAAVELPAVHPGRRRARRARGRQRRHPEARAGGRARGLGAGLVPLGGRHPAGRPPVPARAPTTRSAKRW